MRKPSHLYILASFVLLLFSCWMQLQAEAAPYVIGSYLTGPSSFGFFKFDFAKNRVVKTYSLPAYAGLASQGSGLIYALQSKEWGIFTIVTVDLNSGRVLRKSPKVDLGFPAFLNFDDGWRAMVVGTYPDVGSGKSTSDISVWTVDPTSGRKRFLCNVTAPTGTDLYSSSYNSPARIVTLTYSDKGSAGRTERLVLLDLNKKAIVQNYHLPTGPGAQPAWLAPSFANLPGKGSVVLGLNLTTTDNTTTAQTTAFDLATKSFNLNMGGRVPIAFDLFRPVTSDVDRKQKSFGLWVQEHGRDGPSIARWSLPDGTLTVTPIKPWNRDHYLWHLLTFVEH